MFQNIAIARSEKPIRLALHSSPGSPGFCRRHSSSSTIFRKTRRKRGSIPVLSNISFSASFSASISAFFSFAFSAAVSALFSLAFSAAVSTLFSSAFSAAVSTLFSAAFSASLSVFLFSASLSPAASRRSSAMAKILSSRLS